MAGIAESCGQVSAAFQLLHRFWNDVYPQDRDGNDFEKYRFYHGRLGVGYGILSLVEEWNTTAVEESLQNLYRVRDSDHRGSAWAGVAWLWAGDVKQANALINQAVQSFVKNKKVTLEDIDAWLAVVEALYIIAGAEWPMLTFSHMHQAAKELGDLPRQARILSLISLFYAEFNKKDFETFYRGCDEKVFIIAKRLNEPHIIGFQQLALGRYFSKMRKPAKALYSLNQAVLHLESAGRYPWIILARIEAAKALIDCNKIPEANMIIKSIDSEIDRYQIWLPWLEEVKGQTDLLQF